MARQRTPSSLARNWFQGNVLREATDTAGNKMTTFSFDWNSPAKGVLLQSLLGELNLWPVAELPDPSQQGFPPQDWQGFVVPGQPLTGNPFPMGLGVLFETDQGFGIKVLVVSRRDPVRLIEPALDQAIETLGVWAGGMPDSDEAAADERVIFLANEALLYCAGHGEDWVHVVTSVGASTSLDTILGRQTRILYPQLSYNGNEVAIVAIATSQAKP